MQEEFGLFMSAALPPCRGISVSMTLYILLFPHSLFLYLPSLPFSYCLISLSLCSDLSPSSSRHSHFQYPLISRAFKICFLTFARLLHIQKQRPSGWHSMRILKSFLSPTHRREQKRLHHNMMRKRRCQMQQMTMPEGR